MIGRSFKRDPRTHWIQNELPDEAAKTNAIIMVKRHLAMCKDRKGCEGYVPNKGKIESQIDNFVSIEKIGQRTYVHTV